jgi:hypothetical protein
MDSSAAAAPKRHPYRTPGYAEMGRMAQEGGVLWVWASEPFDEAAFTACARAALRAGVCRLVVPHDFLSAGKALLEEWTREGGTLFAVKNLRDFLRSLKGRFLRVGLHAGGRLCWEKAKRPRAPGMGLAVVWGGTPAVRAQTDYAYKQAREAFSPEEFWNWIK